MKVCTYKLYAGFLKRLCQVTSFVDTPELSQGQSSDSKTYALKYQPRVRICGGDTHMTALDRNSYVLERSSFAAVRYPKRFLLTKKAIYLFSQQKRLEVSRRFKNRCVYFCPTDIFATGSSQPLLDPRLNIDARRAP